MSGRGCPSSPLSGRAQAAVVTAAGGRGAPVGGWPLSGTPHCPALALRTRHTALRSTLPRRARSLTGSSAAARQSVTGKGKSLMAALSCTHAGDWGTLGQGPWGLCLFRPELPGQEGTRTPRALCRRPVTASSLFHTHSKTTQRNKQIAMGRKKFNMDPKKVSGQARARVQVTYRQPRHESQRKGSHGAFSSGTARPQAQERLI